MRFKERKRKAMSKGSKHVTVAIARHRCSSGWGCSLKEEQSAKNEESVYVQSNAKMTLRCKLLR